MVMLMQGCMCIDLNSGMFGTYQAVVIVCEREREREREREAVFFFLRGSRGVIHPHLERHD